MILGRTPQKKGRPSVAQRLVQDAAALPREARLTRLIVGTAFVVLVAAVTAGLTPTRDELEQYDPEAEVWSSRTVKADFPFRTVDVEATQAKKEEAAAAVPDYYRIDQGRVAAHLRELDEYIEAVYAQRNEVDKRVREALLESTSAEPVAEVVKRAVEAYARDLVQGPVFKEFSDDTVLALWLMPKPECVAQPVYAEEARAESAAGKPVVSLSKPELPQFEFANVQRLGEWSRTALANVLSHGVLNPDDLKVAPGDSERKIIIMRHDPLGAQSQSEVVPMAEAPFPQNARQRLRKQVTAAAQATQPSDEHAEVPADWTPLEEAAFQMAAMAVGDTLFFDKVTTEGRREEARREVEETEPVFIEIGYNQNIQRQGELWTPKSRALFRAYMDERRRRGESGTSLASSLLAHSIMVALALAFLARVTPLLASSEQNASREFRVCILILCLTLALGRIVYEVNPTGSSGFAVPIAAAAMLVAILTNARVALLFATVGAVLLSVQFDYSWRLFFVAAAMAFTGALSIYKVRVRRNVETAALKATVVGAVTIVAITVTSDFTLAESPQRFLLIALNGLASWMIVLGLLSPLERLFGITTDIQLLEYSDLNNEVLSRLAIEVPATYSHSLVVGQLAEAAADAIGANGLLARVMAYYHDIGKMRRPEYFAENQVGANIHDELAPRMSARAIASHVAEGAEMARDFRLPKPIVDAIFEHHGTSLISFFYQNALKQQKHGDVREEDFRYPGPKPQSPETAILMIADAVESSVRTIKNPNEERVREMVDKIVTTRANDRQFDECDLTLKDLDTIGEVLAKRVLSMMHRRPDYPETRRPEPRVVNNVIAMPGGQEQ